MKKMIRVYIDGFKLYDLAKNKGSGVCALSKQLGCDPGYLGMHAREGWLPRSKYEELFTILGEEFSCSMPGRKYVKSTVPRGITKGKKHQQHKSRNINRSDYDMTDHEILLQILAELKELNSYWR